MKEVLRESWAELREPKAVAKHPETSGRRTSLLSQGWRDREGNSVSEAAAEKRSGKSQDRALERRSRKKQLSFSSCPLISCLCFPSAKPKELGDPMVKARTEVAQRMSTGVGKATASDWQMLWHLLLLGTQSYPPSRKVRPRGFREIQWAGQKDCWRDW